jgi:hypothetical protein
MRHAKQHDYTLDSGATWADAMDDRRSDPDAHKGTLRRWAEGLLAWAVLVGFAWWVIVEGVTR